MQAGDVARAEEVIGCAPSMRALAPEPSTVDRVVMAWMLSGGGFEAVRVAAAAYGHTDDGAVAELWRRVQLAERAFGNERARRRG